MEQNEKVKKEKKKINIALRIIGDVIFVPITIFVLVATIILFNAKNNNEVPSLFGYSVVKIQSPSMSYYRTENGEKIEQPEFAEGQCIVIKAVDTSELEVGDPVAFYEYMEGDEQEKYESSSMNISMASIVGGASNSNQKRVAKYSKVVFHRIVGLSKYTNEDGSTTIFFHIKGDTDGATEAYIREDYIVGKYVSTNSFVCSIFNFCTSTVGSIVLIIVPSAVLIVILGYNVVVEYQGMKNEEYGNFENKKQKEILSEVTNDKKHQSKKKKEKEEKLQEEKEKMLNEILAEDKSGEVESKEPLTENKKKNEQKKEPAVPTQPAKPPATPKRPPAPPKKPNVPPKK